MDPYAGEIRIFAGSYAPVGWQFCAGQTLNISQYELLFALLGTTYGGDGRTTFGLPDLRGRVPVSLGTGPLLSAYILGAYGGVESVALTQNQLPNHTHPLTANTVAATVNSPAGNVTALANTVFYAQAAASVIEALPMAGVSVQASGQNGSHDNSMPSVPLNFIIAVEGLYPQQA